MTFDLQLSSELATDQIIDEVLAKNGGPACLTCSFQAEDMIVLDLLRKRLPEIPVLFLETGYHFAETYEYRDRIAKQWSLNLVNVLPAQDCATAGIRAGHLVSERAHAMLSAAQS